MLANFLAAAASYDVNVRLNAGFKDDEVNDLLGLDTQDEVSLAVMELGERNPIQDGAGKIDPVNFKITPLSASPVDYPEIREIHDASYLRGRNEVLDWRSNAEIFLNEKVQAFPESEKSLREMGFRMFPLIEGKYSADSIDDVILRRGSARRFEPLSINFEELSIILRSATRIIPADFLPSGLPTLNEIYLIVSAVDGLPAGAYYFDRHQDTLVLLKEGNFRREAGGLGLGQELAADASVNVYFLSDLKKVLCTFGDRGYRAAQLEAGVMGGKLYLGAYAQSLAASGLTFYDDEVISFFEPHAKGKEVMFLVLLGRRKINRSRS
jgi:SagB-type dehydrogenase family enzyme